MENIVLTPEELKALKQMEEAAQKRKQGATKNHRESVQAKETVKIRALQKVLNQNKESNKDSDLKDA